MMHGKDISDADNRLASLMRVCNELARVSVVLGAMSGFGLEQKAIDRIARDLAMQAFVDRGLDDEEATP